MLKVLVSKTEGKIQLRRPRRRCEDDIKIELKYFVSLWFGSPSSV
jgi:hypothetical protein